MVARGYSIWAIIIDEIHARAPTHPCSYKNSLGSRDPVGQILSVRMLGLDSVGKVLDLGARLVWFRI